tara:strand:- start:340 stop:480 length:141 start_codon:yes stop_codon:yes gene_type:complete
MQTYTKRILLEVKINDGEIFELPIYVECIHYLSAASIDEDEWCMLR